MEFWHYLDRSRAYQRHSQAELARRAGLARSVINVYERGRREPGAGAFIDLLGVCGVAIELAPAPSAIDLDRAASILEQVLDLAASLPHRKGKLRFPPFRERIV